MKSSLLAGAAVLAAVALFLPRLLSRFRNSMTMFRALNAADGARHEDMSLIAAYHGRMPGGAGAESVDDRTWRDLDLDDVFRSLDHTASEPGRQYLYHLLRTPQASTEPLATLDRAVRSLDDDGIARRVRAALAPLRDERAAYLQQLLFGELPVRPQLWWIFPVLTASAVSCLVLIAIWPPAALVWLGICVINIGVQLTYKRRVKNFVAALHEMPAFIRVAGSLAAIPLPGLPDEVRMLADGAGKLDGVRRATSWLMFEPGQSNELASMVYEYVNLFFLFDVNAFVFAAGKLRSARDVTRGMFGAMGRIDAAQSIAAWRKSLPSWSVPVFTGTSKELHAEALFHPLLADPVANSLYIEGTGVVITCSNMSGKTTFIRALGVNAVLARTLSTVCARAWRAPLLRVRTSIGRNDSLVEGKSYYLAEVESVLALLRAKDDGAPHLFLLDEIFRGTNTSERVAAAYAVLDHLNRGPDIVVVATHDLEVLDMLSGTFTARHFREQVTGDALTFDYLIQPGPASTRNAIALLKFMKYPESLVTAALGALDRRSSRD